MTLAPHRPPEFHLQSLCPPSKFCLPFRPVSLHLISRSASFYSQPGRPPGLVTCSVLFPVRFSAPVSAHGRLSSVSSIGPPPDRHTDACESPLSQDLCTAAVELLVVLCARPLPPALPVRRRLDEPRLQARIARTITFRISFSRAQMLRP
jgi:hypothetical protein